MHVLLIHNKYGAYSGEEAVVEKQTALFRSMGHRVSCFFRNSADIRTSFLGNIKAFFNGFYSRSAVREIKKRLQSDRPDVTGRMW